MNVNLLANNPSWWWYPILSGAALGLVLVIWVIVCLSQAGLRNARTWRKKKKMRKIEIDLETGDIAPDKEKLH